MSAGAHAPGGLERGLCLEDRMASVKPVEFNFKFPNYDILEAHYLGAFRDALTDEFLQRSGGYIQAGRSRGFNFDFARHGREGA